MEIEKRRKEAPHMWNLNEDPALTDMIVHFVDPGENLVGNGSPGSTSKIQLKGLSILPSHARLINKDNKKVTLIPLSGAEILVNGKHISQETELNQNDRQLFKSLIKTIVEYCLEATIFMSL